MGTFKTLEAYFKPVQRPPDSGAPVPNSTDPPPAQSVEPPQVAPCVPEARNAGCGGAAAQPPPASVPRPLPPAPIPAAAATSSRPATASHTPSSSRQSGGPKMGNAADRSSAAALKSPSKPFAAGTGATTTGVVTAAVAAATAPAAPRSGADLLAQMLHGRKKAQAASAPGLTAAAAVGGANVAAGSHSAPVRLQGGGQRSASAVVAAAARLRTGAVVFGAEEAGALQDPPRKRPCLTLSSSATAAAARALPPHALPPPLERRPNLVCLVQARSTGCLAAHRALWWDSRRGLRQVGCWNAAEGLRSVSVVQQDAVTQIEISSETDTRAYLAIAQANQLVRIVPYSVLRDYVETRQAAGREAVEAASNSDSGSDDGDDYVGGDQGADEGGDGDDDGGGNGNDGRGGGEARLGPPWLQQSLQRRRRRRRFQALPWQDLVDAGRVVVRQRSAAAWGYDAPGGSHARSSAVLTLNTRSHVACLGWDPRRSGRLAMADRSSSSITILDLGWGSAGGGGCGASNGEYRRAGNFTRSQLNAGSGGPGGAAARAMTYLKYGGRRAPYTLAAAGRAGGDGAVVHLWDDRRGNEPVSRLACPGGASLVTRMEPSLDDTALLSIIQPGTLVLWDVRRASSAAASNAVFSLGASAPLPSAVIRTWDVLAPLAAAGCIRPVISSLATDPRDASRVALLAQDGSAAVFSLPAGAITHVSIAAALPQSVARLDTSSTAAAPAAVPPTLAPAAVGDVADASVRVTARTLPTLRRSQGGTMETLTEYGFYGMCAVAGLGLYGSWDADVCGFWHPTVHAAGSGEWLRPGLALADCRTSRSSCAAAATARPSPAAAVAAAALLGPRAASGFVTTAAVAATEPSGAPPAPAVLQRLSDWPLCVACLPGTGDLVMGSLKGNLLYYRKA